MRYLYLVLLVWFMMSCAGNNVPTKDHLPPADTAGDSATETDTDTDTDSDTDADSDTDTDADSDTDTAPDECAEAATLCGQELTTVDRSSWGANLSTQNSGLTDWTDPDEVVWAVVSGYYPPIPSWPSVSNFPASYDIGDELNADYGYGWYSDSLDWPPDEHLPIAVTVHHTAAETSDCDAYVAAVANYHIFGEGRGWGDIGYQMMVCEDASGLHIYEGRMCTSTGPFSSMWCVGAHTTGYNTGYVGISLVGDFTSVTPTATEFETLEAVVTRAMFEAGITDSTEIRGHRDLGSTECPGDQLYAMLPDIQARVDWCQACGY